MTLRNLLAVMEREQGQKIEAYKNRTLIKKELLVTLMDEEVQGFRFSEALNGFVIYLK